MIAAMCVSYMVQAQYSMKNSQYTKIKGVGSTPAWVKDDGPRMWQLIAQASPCVTRIVIGLLLQLWIKVPSCSRFASGSMDSAVTLDIRNIEVGPGEYSLPRESTASIPINNCILQSK